MRTYVYISEQKVELLFPQVPKRIKGAISTELGVNLGVFKASARHEPAQDPHMVAQLAAVERTVLDKVPVGSVDEDAPWIKGQMSMRFATFPERPSVTFLAGGTVETNLLLAGSASNFMGAPIDPSQVQNGGSYMPFILETLDEMMAAGNDLRIPVDQAGERLSSGVGHPDSRSVWADVVDRIVQRERSGPALELEFLARRLVLEAPDPDQPSATKRSMLATPLYVAMT